ncbi:hypothetical protein ACFSJ3_04295 [Corallincola platygyrae]|uniref:Serine/threonine protein kinase n=1 Tax=Corallincola platygyrae TaxID=1193278 RepID=A0ABW4XMF9_9GAMM
MCQFEVDGRKFWLKHAGEEKSRWIHHLLRWLSKPRLLSWANSHAWMAPEQRLQQEVRQLLSLSMQNLPVIKITSFNATGFVTRDAGINAKQALQQSDNKRALLRDIFKALAKLHRAGVVHGRPALRDIAVDNWGKVTFMDFEESPPRASPQLMARDAIILLNECYRIDDIRREHVHAAFSAWRKHTRRQAWHATECCARWLIRLLVWPANLMACTSKKPRRQRLSRALDSLAQLTRSPVQQSLNRCALPFGF